ncbi:MAG: hypothetical protein LAT64_10780 [Phycisphaerales bacterium]|nr:hypothetical protein [Planctomycetota bacterium]MCH8509236.1 hypothetical protein [Phycisphaerales bacterium]
MKPMRWIWGIVLLVVPHAAAQPMEILYDDLDPQLKAEVKVFISMYTHLLIHGEPAEGADAFSFTHPDANSPLFQPYVAYVRTLAKIKGGGDSRFFGHLVGPADVAAYSDGTFVFTPTSEPAPTLNHLSAIMASGGTAQASVTDGVLSSVGLGVQPVEGGSPYVSPLDPPEFEDWMADLASLAANTAATLDPAMDIRHMLLGEPTNAERMRASLDAWLQVHRADDFGLGSYVIHGMFGRFGALPVIVLSYADGYLLVDGIDGTLAGPYLYDDEIDLVSLVSLRSEHDGVSSVSGVNMGDSSTAVLAKRIRNKPPRHYERDPSCPGNLECWEPRNAPAYDCQPRAVSGGGCVCKARGNWVPGPNAPAGSPPNVTTYMTCTIPGPGSDCPQSTSLPAPPTHIPAPADCKQTWYHDQPV